jgi:hypothetical protein
MDDEGMKLDMTKGKNKRMEIGKREREETNE